MTIVLCPNEKNNPHVTGSWPILIRLRVALSIALFVDTDVPASPGAVCTQRHVWHNLAFVVSFPAIRAD